MSRTKFTSNCENKLRRTNSADNHSWCQMAVQVYSRVQGRDFFKSHIVRSRDAPHPNVRHVRRTLAFDPRSVRFFRRANVPRKPSRYESAVCCTGFREKRVPFCRRSGFCRRASLSDEKARSRCACAARARSAGTRKSASAAPGSQRQHT